MTINVDVVIKIIIPILGAIITYILIPMIKEKTTKEQRDNVYSWVKLAVSAAEMIYKEKGQGQIKKEYVIDYLVSKNIKITLEDLDLMIESAVNELNRLKIA